MEAKVTGLEKRLKFTTTHIDTHPERPIFKTPHLSTASSELVDQHVIR